MRPKLERLARKHPELAPALRGKAPSPIEVLSVRAPTRAHDLNKLERNQLLLAAKKYDGKRVLIEQRFGPDDGSETSFGSTLLLVTLGEKGVPSHDAVLFAGDAGSVFRHGTTTEVAARIQGGLEARNADLASRLSEALAKAERAQHKTKAPAKKAPATRPRQRRRRSPRDDRPAGVSTRQSCLAACRCGAGA